MRAGKTVLRLKQGDPFIYGRGGEEVAFFREHGLGSRVVVLPGITSALSAPLFAGVPATQRDVADQVLICTGTGKKGKPPVKTVMAMPVAAIASAIKTRSLLRMSSQRFVDMICQTVSAGIFGIPKLKTTARQTSMAAAPRFAVDAVGIGDTSDELIKVEV